MFINIRDLDPEGLHLDDEISIPPFPWDGGQTVRCGPARLTGSIVPSSRGLEFDARLRTVAEVACARCLEPFRHTVDERFRLFVVAADDGGADDGDEGRREVADAVDVYAITGERLDVVDVLREQIDLALPVTAVCSPRCRGYCPGCGVRLDREACRCEPAADGAWGELRQIRDVLARRREPDGTKGE